jgi:hypothetical protein
MDDATFSDRLAIGQDHEQAVFDALADMGFVPHWFDRRIYEEKFAQAIHSPLFRHAPDIVVGGGDNAAFVECKSVSERNRHTGNYSIEIECHQAMLTWARLGAPTYYVFHDFQVSAVHEVDKAPRVALPSMPYRTPGFLVAKTDLRRRHLVDDNCNIGDPDFYFDCIGGWRAA